MQTDTKTFHIKCMLEGALYKELGEEEYALQVSDQITPNRKCLYQTNSSYSNCFYCYLIGASRAMTKLLQTRNA